MDISNKKLMKYHTRRHGHGLEEEILREKVSLLW